MANFGIIEFVLLETRKVEKSEPAQVQNQKFSSFQNSRAHILKEVYL